MLEKIKYLFFRNINFVDIVFCSAFSFGWFHNAEAATKFDLNQLTLFYGTVRAFILGGRVNDSVNNSPPHEPPK